jgi:hypothetical protein
MTAEPPGFFAIVLKTVVVHTATYFLAGLVASLALGYGRRFAEPPLSLLMLPTDDPRVMAGPLFQPARGLLFGLAFYALRPVVFRRPDGWLVLWLVLVVVGVLSTFGPSPGSVEGMVYTALPWWAHLFGLPEVLAQAGLLAFVLWYWVNHPGRRWLSWALGVAFALALGLPALGLLARQGRPAG